MKRALGPFAVSRVVLAFAIALISLAGTSITPRPAGAVPLTNVHAVVTTVGGLNLRKGPSWTYGVVRVLPNGTPVTVLSTASDWYKIQALGRTGYVNSWFVTLVGTPSTVIYRGSTARKMIALTFDAGSDLGSTDRILSILRSNKIRASFGLTGDWIKANPEAAARITSAGHQIINHTVNHWSYTGESTGDDSLSPARRLSQLIGNESLLQSAGATAGVPYWRPPYGDINTGVLRDVGAAGYSKTVMWTVDSMGWNGYSADQIYQRVIGAAGSGVIVLMHVGSDSHDADALSRIIATLKARGYSFGTVAQVIA